MKTLDVLYAQTVKPNDRNEMNLIAAIVFPHLTPVRAKDSNDSSVSNTIARRAHS